MIHDDRIAKAAHALWEAEGRPHGCDKDHWDKAVAMIATQDSEKKVAAAPKKASADAVKKSAKAPVKVAAAKPAPSRARTAAKATA